MSWIEQRPDDAMDGAFTAVGPETVRTIEPEAFRRLQRLASVKNKKLVEVAQQVVLAEEAFQHSDRH